MFADLVDLGFDEVLKLVKESTEYYPEMEDDEYSDLYMNLMSTSFRDYKRRMYFKRSTWPYYMIRLEVTDTSFNAVPDEIQDLSIKEIIEKVNNGELIFGFALVSTKVYDTHLDELDTVLIYHHLNLVDIFAEDWCCYNIEK